MKVTEYCVDCQGSGQIVIGEHLITREMALDAGEPQMEGSHFAVFPEKLITPCILAGSRKGGQVLDPFCGSGTTGVVCAKWGRDFTGIELNPEYVEMATKRIKKASQQMRLMV